MKKINLETRSQIDQHQEATVTVSQVLNTKGYFSWRRRKNMTKKHIKKVKAGGSKAKKVFESLSEAGWSQSLCR